MKIISAVIIFMVLGWLCVVYTVNKLNKSFNKEPLIQLTNLTTGATEQIIPGNTGADITPFSTQLPESEYTYHKWSKCQKFQGVVVQTPRNLQPAITIYYTNICK